MNRRDFTTLVAGAVTVCCVAAPFVARAQQPAMPVIGSLYSVSAAEWRDNIAGFSRGLSEAGFVDGRNVKIEYRWADGQLDLMPKMAADLIDRKVAAMLIGGNTTSVRTVLQANRTVPFVFTTAADPVASGLVASLNRPGGNATGVTLFGGELVAKKLGLLHELVPKASKVAVLVNPGNPVLSKTVAEEAQSAASRLGWDIVVLNAASEPELAAAFAAASRQNAAIFGQSNTPAAGILIGYGPSIPDSYRQAGVYVGRILKGDRAGDLPVMQPTKFDMIINLKTAKALGIEIPPTLLARADEVIE
jgi:putative ABC transport system substrate-binding protein